MNMISAQLFKNKLPSEYAQDIHDIVLTHAAENENQRTLAPSVIKSLKEANLLKMGLPEYLGGWANTPVEALKVFEVLASADPSVAWVVWNTHTSCVLGRYLEKNSLNELFNESTHAVANAGNPQGVAQEVEGGYNVSGQWSLVSGCEVADLFILRCLISPKAAALTLKDLGPETSVKWAIVNRNDIEVVDTWYVGGLKGTGSHDIVVKNAFVPSSQVFDFDHPIAIDSAYNRLPFAPIVSAGCASIALGILRGTINTVMQICSDKITPGKRPDLRDRERVQIAVAKSKTHFSSAHNQLHNSVSVLWDNAQNNDTSTDQQLADVWASAVAATTVSRAMITELFDVTGTASLYQSNNIEKAHRDIHAVAQHGIVQPHWMTMAGMTYVGLTPPSPMFRT